MHLLSAKVDFSNLVRGHVKENKGSRQIVPRRRDVWVPSPNSHDGLTAANLFAALHAGAACDERTKQGQSQ